jgi:hypothetical protein
MRFHLVVFGQPAPSSEALGLRADLLGIHAIRADAANGAELARVRIPKPSFYLVRPDGYVGLCGVRPEPAAIARYIADSLG